MLFHQLHSPCCHIQGRQSPISREEIVSVENVYCTVHVCIIFVVKYVLFINHSVFLFFQDRLPFGADKKTSST